MDPVQAVRSRGAAPASVRRSACPLCDHRELLQTVRLGDGWLLTCPRCGARCTEHLGTDAELRQYYDRVLAHHGKAEALDGQEGPLDAIAREQADSMERVLGPRRQGRFLEVGCARGHLLAEMRLRGWDVRGIEISARAAQLARERTGAEVHHGGPEDAPFGAGSFDRVGLFDVLAHLADPVQTLRVIRSLLVPGGHLVLSTVDEHWPLVPAFHLAFRLAPGPTSGLRDEMYEGQHYCYFGHKNIGVLLERTGFALEHHEPLLPLSARYFVHQYGLRRRLALLGMARLDRALGSARKMLVVARAVSE